MSRTVQRTTAAKPTGKSAAPGSRYGAQRPFAAQTKLSIGAPGDRYEQEADRVAEQVMRMPEASCPAPLTGSTSPNSRAIMRACTECEEEPQRYSRENGDVIQAQTIEEGQEEEEMVLQVKRDGDRMATVSPEVQSQVASLRGGGRPLPDSTRAFFEPRFGFDFSRIRVHKDGMAAESSRALHARAYTFGRHIAFASGQYSPQSEEGKRLLAHELTHVIQQGRADRLSLSGHAGQTQPRIQQVSLGVQRAVTYEGALIQSDIDPLDPRTAPPGKPNAIGHTAFEVNGQDVQGLAGPQRMEALFPLPIFSAVFSQCLLVNRNVNVRTRNRVRIPTQGPWSRVIAKSGLGGLFGGLLSRRSACSGTGNSTVTAVGNPSDSAVRAMSLEAEMQHAQDDRCLVDRYLKAYESDVNALPGQFPRGYLGFGSCNERLTERLRRHQRDTAFFREQASFAQDYDGRDGSHGLNTSVSSGTGCNSVTLNIGTRPLPPEIRDCAQWSPPGARSVVKQ